ncbi:hypothetical protein D3C80_1458850 [compost metagenome]
MGIGILYRPIAAAGYIGDIVFVEFHMGKCGFQRCPYAQPPPVGGMEPGIVDPDNILILHKVCMIDFIELVHCGPIVAQPEHQCMARLKQKLRRGNRPGFWCS